MPRSLLPPRGIFVPASLLFDKELTPAMRDTAIQLRALAWGQDETPAISLNEISETTGKSQATLYGHMRLLRLRGALRWRPAGKTEIIVSFDPTFWNSKILEKPDPLIHPSKPSIKQGIKDTTFQDSGKPEKANYFPLAQALAEVCHMDISANSGRLFKDAKTLTKANPAATPELLRQHYNGRPDCFWRSRDWRGQKGQDPNPATIRETWGKWELPIAIPGTERQHANHEKRSEPSGDPSGELSQAQLIARRLSGD